MYSDEAEDETLLERIAALKDVVPPAQRRQLQSAVNTTSEWSWWGVSNLARLSWVVGVSAILLAIPFAVGSSEDQQIAMEEKQELMRQSQTEVSTRPKFSAIDMFGWHRYVLNQAQTLTELHNR